MILIGIGANLPSPEHGSPQATCEAAVEALGPAGLSVIARSGWFKSAPVPVSDQPWYINGVVAIETGLPPAGIMERLLLVETDFGRQRGVPNAARILDLDLLAYGDMVLEDQPGGLVIPHPRLHERGFVLLPIQVIAPDWRHPVSHDRVEDMISVLPPDQHTEPA